MEKKFANEYVKYIFNDREKAEIAADMAQKVSELQQTEDDKKAIMSDFKSKIDGIQANINNNATKLNSGYGMRSIKCEVVPNWKKKVWEYTREDNGKIAREKPMNSDDLQMEFE